MTVEVAECPVCGATRRRRLPVPGHAVGDGRFGDGAGLVACRACGFVFVSPRPDDAALAAFYDAQDYTAGDPDDAAGAALAVGHQLDALARAGVTVGPGTRLLDIGCGGGHMLAAARARGAEVLGVDAGAPSRAACAARDLPVIASADGLRGFDVVVISHTLEHVPDLGATLARCREALAPGGRLLIEVPNARSLRARAAPPWASRAGVTDERYRAFPVHLSYFAPRTLRALLARHGLDVEAMTTRGLGFSASMAKPATSRSASGAPARPRRPSVKARAKAAFMDALLGENLIAIATSSSARAASPRPAARAPL